MLPSMEVNSPAREMRQPRFSAGGQGTPNENCPRRLTGQDPGSRPSFPRQFVASPMKPKDRNVLLLLGNKINSSVPGRRSSIGCINDRIPVAPQVRIERDCHDAGSNGSSLLSGTTRRSKSLKTNSHRALEGTSFPTKTLKRL
jgi:hypothetical protein